MTELYERHADLYDLAFVRYLVQLQLGADRHSPFAGTAVVDGAQQGWPMLWHELTRDG